jgi:hypothetical protein
MIIHKELKRFLEVIYLKNLDFKDISEYELRKQFKNNEYYQLLKFCILNNLLIIEFKHINLTLEGINFFKILKNLNNI